MTFTRKEIVRRSYLKNIEKKKEYTIKNKDNKKIYDKERYLKNKESINKERKVRYQKNKMKETSKMKEYRESNKDKIKQYQIEWAKNNPEKVEKGWRNYRYKKYGLSIEGYEKLLEEQNNKCAICKIDQSQLKENLCLDHCHQTIKYRGLLCKKCNSAIGLFNDDLEIIKNAFEYLKSFKPTT